MHCLHAQNIKQVFLLHSPSKLFWDAVPIPPPFLHINRADHVLIYPWLPTRRRQMVEDEKMKKNQTHTKEQL
jgi:hypothetical protein